MMPTSGQLLFDMLQNAGSVALVAHVSPDMDALGASLGARELLRQGFPALERVDVFCQDPVPESYAFLDLTRLVLPPERAQGPYDLCIAVDVASYDRLGSCAALFDRARARFVIDHHGSNDFENVPRLLLPQSAATAQIVVDLCLERGVRLSAEAASCLYAGVSTDTGNFSFEAVTPGTFRAAAWLVEQGAKPDWITQRLYRTRSVSSVRALGRALDTMRLSAGGRVALLCLSLADRREVGAQDGDYEGIVNYGIETKGVLAAALVSQRDEGIRCSVRTKEGVDAAAVARRFGGGGHPRAAGMSLQGELDQALEAVRCALEEAVEEACRTDS